MFGAVAGEVTAFGTVLSAATRRGLSVYCAMVLSGCGGHSAPTASGPLLLVDHGRWLLVADRDSDPFAVDRGRPTVHACESGALLEPQSGFLEVELPGCRERYVSMHQPSLASIQRGDVLEFDLTHLLLRPLTVDTVEAYLGLSVNGTVIWQQTIVIPAAADEFLVDIAVPQQAEIGSDVVLHIDNHGENSYTFGPIAIQHAVPTTG